MTTSEVARAFGLGTPGRELTHVARGAMGEVFRLDTERGPFAVKRLLWGPTGDEEPNVAFQFAAADAGVPLARPLLTTNGDVLKRLGDGWWRAYEWVDAAACGDTPVGTQVAAALGRLHGLAYYFEGEPSSWFWDSLGAERISNAIDIALRHGFAVEDRRKELMTLDEIVAGAARDEPLVGCHHDTEKQNVLVRADGIVLIDWDNAGAGIADREFGAALQQWDAEVPAMVHAYRDAGGVFAPTDLSVFASRFSSWVQYFVNCCEHLEAPGVKPDELLFERPVLDALQTRSFALERFERILELVPDE
jgi:Ser/Thr protein kinase RdoA (MazF antagonist)